MGPPSKPYQPYASVHEDTQGPGDARPDWMQVLKDCDAIGALKGKTVLITGCSAGLGVETAKAMYEAGATCFFQARDMKKLDVTLGPLRKKLGRRHGRTYDVLRQGEQGPLALERTVEAFGKIVSNHKHRHTGFTP